MAAVSGGDTVADGNNAFAIHRTEIPVTSRNTIKVHGTGASCEKFSSWLPLRPFQLQVLLLGLYHYWTSTVASPKLLEHRNMSTVCSTS